MTDISDAYDIFLSYARIDNEKETDDRDERGWVDHFQSRLLKQLIRRGRADVGFWRDVAEIAGADRFAAEIIKGLAESTFFLPVLSPTYIQRPWCQEEVAPERSSIAFKDCSQSSSVPASWSGQGARMPISKESQRFHATYWRPVSAMIRCDSHSLSRQI